MQLHRGLAAIAICPREDDDIIVLARVFLEKYAAEQGRPIRGFSQVAENILQNYECKDNVRELEKIVRRAVIMTEETFIQPQGLHLEINPGAIPENDKTTENTLNLAMARSITEKRTITSALNQTEGNI
jgi:DNA-binding NtrC family response regulator